MEIEETTMEETKSIVCVWAKRESKYYHDFYLLDSNSNTDSIMCSRACSMCSADLPDMFGWAFLYPYIYIVGGQYLNRKTIKDKGPINDVYIFDTTTTNSKWEKSSASMNGSRTFPVVVPLINRNRLYVFGCTSSDDWAEYYDPDTNKWISLPEPPVKIYDRGEALGHVVVNNENRIILWNAYYFFALNLETDIPTWELQETPKQPPLRFSPYFAVVKDVLYWYCLDSLYAYDLAANHSFSAPIYKIDFATLMDPHCYYECESEKHFLFGNTENDLCIIWSKLGDNNTNARAKHTTMEVSFVKLRIERCDHDASVGEAKGIHLHKIGSATFYIPGGHLIDGCLGAVKLRNNTKGQILFNNNNSDSSEVSRFRKRDFVSFRFDNKGLQKAYPITCSSLTKAPQGLLEKLSETMYKYAWDCHTRVLDSNSKMQTIQKAAKSLDAFLQFLSLETYLCKFQEEEIDLDVLKLFNDKDFEELQIPEETKEKILDALPYVA